jgi:hypothetical protein
MLTISNLKQVNDRKLKLLLKNAELLLVNLLILRNRKKNE